MGMRYLLAGYVVLAVGIAYAFYAQWLFAQSNHKAIVALCAQRHDLDGRIARTAQVLEQQKGQLVFGIPRPLIVQGQIQSMLTRQNLSILDCS